MQSVELDPFICPDDGHLPDNLFEFMNEDHLLKYLDSDFLFDDKLLNIDDDVDDVDDGDPPDPDGLPQGQQHQLTGQPNTRRKRPRVPRTPRCTDESKLTRTKRQRAGSDTSSSEPSQAETADFCASPQGIYNLPSIQFITVPDTTGYQVVQTLSLPSTVIRFPLPNAAATPTYVLVPTPSLPCTLQLPPLSPVDGAVAPVQMSSSPPGSLSDSTSKAMSPPCASPLYLSNDTTPFKESPVPQSLVVDVPQSVTDYIQEAKAHMNQTCDETEAGLSLTSHYVDVQMIRRETRWPGRTANKCLSKQLVILGDTDRQNRLLGRSQIFESLNGNRPKRYVLLLGNAGVGKTSLIRRTCLDWSRGGFPQFDFVFLLDGKTLTLTEPAYSLQTLLLNLSSFAPPCFDPEAVYSQILAAPRRVLIIFDGFDELRDYECLLQTQEKDFATLLQKDSRSRTYTVGQLYSAILQRVLLPGCTLLLSTRPRGTASQLLRRVDSFLEVCGFSPECIESYFCKYFTDPALRSAAMDCLENCRYLHLLCCNPGLCRLVCLILEQSKGSQVLPRTLTGLCHQVLCLKMEEDSRALHLQTEVQRQILLQSEEDTQRQFSSSAQERVSSKNTETNCGPHVGTRVKIARRAKQEREEQTEETKTEEEQRRILSQLCSLAWVGVKANSSILPKRWTVSAKVKAFGLRTGLLRSHQVHTGQILSSGEKEEGGRGGVVPGRGDEGEQRGNQQRTDIESEVSDKCILLWANPFLQSYLAGVHRSLLSAASDRTFLQTLSFQEVQKGRLRSQREELELTQRFAVGLLFHNWEELQRLHLHTKTAFREIVTDKQALVTEHIEGLSHVDLSPAQVLKACHYVYEVSFTHGDSYSDGTQLAAHLAANLPDALTFRGVSLSPPDMYAVQNILERGGREGKCFSLDLENSGIQISGLRSLVGLCNINTYRACIADLIALWEQLEQNGETGLLHQVVSKFKIYPMKATQVCHIHYLTKLVNMHRRLSDNCSPSDSTAAEEVTAVKELHTLEFELGPECGPLPLPKLWELLLGLHDLQHLDLENCLIGDDGCEKLTDVFASMCSLEVLNLSQNGIGDQGVIKLSSMLGHLPKLRCLSLYSNVISDEGAWSLSAVLPHTVLLTDLDVKYNKLTEVGAYSLAASLRNCKHMKTLRMWNQCIPFGVFERLQQQDPRIHCH